MRQATRTASSTRPGLAFRPAPGAAGTGRLLIIVPGKWRHRSAALRAIARQCIADRWPLSPDLSSKSVFYARRLGNGGVPRRSPRRTARPLIARRRPAPCRRARGWTCRKRRGGQAGRSRAASAPQDRGGAFVADHAGIRHVELLRPIVCRPMAEDPPAPTRRCRTRRERKGTGSHSRQRIRACPPFAAREAAVLCSPLDSDSAEWDRVRAKTAKVGASGAALGPAWAHSVGGLRTAATRLFDTLRSHLCTAILDRIEDPLPPPKAL